MPAITRDARDLVRQQLTNPSELEKLNAYQCTIVNLLPFVVKDEKPHLLPGSFTVPAAYFYNGIPKLGILHVGESVDWIPDPFDDKRAHKHITPPHEMARSIVEDWAGAHIALAEGAGPGLFWVPGKKNAAEVVREHADLIAVHTQRQMAWFRELVAMADTDWEKNKNRLSVSDLQRVAAKALGINKDWVTMEVAENKPCPFCTLLIPINAIKCPNCKEIVDRDGYKKLGGGLQ